MLRWVDLDNEAAPVGEPVTQAATVIPPGPGLLGGVRSPASAVPSETAPLDEGAPVEFRIGSTWRNGVVETLGTNNNTYRVREAGEGTSRTHSVASTCVRERPAVQAVRAAFARALALQALERKHESDPAGTQTLAQTAIDVMRRLVKQHPQYVSSFSAPSISPSTASLPACEWRQPVPGAHAPMHTVPLRAHAGTCLERQNPNPRGVI